MTTFPGIQLSSPMVQNSAFPLDRKTLRANTTERNNLDITQRRVGMIGYNQDDQKRYKLINNQPAGQPLLDEDWEEFGTGSFVSGETIVYGRVSLLDVGTDLSSPQFSNASKHKSNKDIFNPATGTLNSDYYKCAWNIIERNYDTIAYIHTGLRFADEAEMRDYIANNVSQTGTPGYNDYSIQAIVYDEIDSSIPTIKGMNVGNTIYQMLRGRHRDKSGNQPTVIEEGSTYMDPALYQGIIQQAIRLMIPGMSSYVYDSGDQPRKVIRTPRGWKNKYNLLNDEALIIPETSGMRYCITSGSFVNNPAYGPYTVLHSESYYMSYELGNYTGGFAFYKKEQFLSLMSDLKSNKTACIFYKLHYNDGVDDYYAIYMKPVGIDALYTEAIDGSKYELNAIIEQAGKHTKFRNIPFSGYFDQIQNKTRIKKSDWMYPLLYGEYNGFPKSKIPRTQTKFVLRDLTTNKISPLSSQTLRFTTGRDRPNMPMLSH